MRLLLIAALVAAGCGSYSTPTEVPIPGAPSAPPLCPPGQHVQQPVIFGAPVVCFTPALTD